MKAVRVHGYKQAPTVDEVTQPDLRSDDDVLVRVGGAGVCRTDLHVVDGWFTEVMPVEPPFTLGHETAGWVEAMGRNVTGMAVGDPVIVHPLRTCGTCWGCRRGEDMYCTASSFPGVNADGGYAEYLRVPSRSLLVLPTDVHPAAVAPHADAGLTAYRAVRKAAALLQPGKTVAVLGVGGLGHIGIQLLRAMTPARILAVDASPTGRTLAAEFGAEGVFGPADAVEGILQATGGVGVDVILDFVGEHGTPGVAIEIVRQGGAYLVVGYGGELGIPTMLLVLKEVTIAGNLVGNHADLEALLALVSAGGLELRTTAFSLDDAPQALDDLDNGRVVGRAVLTPNAS
jgi:NAD+-dependent secondary alcohol dehydrogenase Adh1